MSSDAKLLVGLILGAAAGAVAGILIAPASGKETRENPDFYRDITLLIKWYCAIHRSICKQNLLLKPRKFIFFFNFLWTYF